MSALPIEGFAEQPCDHPDIYNMTSKCGCEFCEQCGEWINTCNTPRSCHRQNEPGDIPAWYDDDLCGDDR
jgi:hypothetical protein